jgi:alkanesulfonate monooxygenase SsuD/methylene tetrahydromethanopterin reductase-like flavin-dependent oxidoreductase (luciferase family)
MTTGLIGADRAELERRARDLAEWQGRPVDLAAAADTWITGTLEEVAARLRAYEDAGVERIYLQHLLHRDLEAVELIGRELVPAVA